MELLTNYIIRLIPGVLLALGFFLLIPRRLVLLRLTGYLLLFIFIRDAMTPAGLWSFGIEGFVWIRFIHSAPLLVVMGLSSFTIVVFMNALDPELKSLLVWFKNSPFTGLIAGMSGALIVVAPLAVIYLKVPLAERGGEVPFIFFLPILLMALLGNLYEEVIFRGYLQGYLETTGGMTSLRAALASGTAFGLGHIFLALTVTSVGWPLIFFALYEGIIAALVRMKFGVIPAALTHGLAIFALASGLL